MTDIITPLAYPPASNASNSFADRAKVAGTKLLHAHIYNKGTARWAFLFDKPPTGTGSSVSTGVSDGWIDAWSLPASADTNIEFGGFARPMSRGIYFIESAVGSSYVSGSSNLLFDILYS